MKQNKIGKTGWILLILAVAVLIVGLIDISSAANDYGCTESGNIVNCTGGTFTGTFITTDKNIIISGATMRTTGFGGGSAVSATWNSSAGNITIISSTIDGYAGSSGGVSSGASATFNLYGGPNGTFIDSTTINAYGGGASCTTNGAGNGGSGTVSFVLTGNLTYTNGVTINSYGSGGCGNGNGNFGAGGNGNFNSFALQTFVLSNRLYVKANGGDAGTGGSSGSGTAQAGDGSATFRDLNITTAIGSNITVDSYGGQASAGHGTQLRGAGNFKFQANQLVNSTFHVNFNQGGNGGGSRTGIWTISNSSDLGVTTNENRYIFRNSTFQGNQGHFVLYELTLLNVTQSSFTPTVNSSADIFRIGNFDSNMALALNYLTSFGAFVVNGTNSFSSLNGAIPINRSLVDYYYPMHKLNTPSSMSAHIPGNISFNITYISEYFTPSNVTFYVWNSTGLYNQTTIAVSGARNSPALSIQILANGNYQWNALLTSTSNLQQLWYGNSNLSFSVGAFVNNETYNSSTYETARETFIANITSTNTIASAIFNYKGTNYTATTTLSGNNTLLTRTIDIPTGAGTNSFYWTITLDDATVLSTPTKTQTVAGINLTICGAAPQNVAYFNFTIKEEGSFNLLNASIESVWTYWLGAGTTNKTYLFSNTTDGQSNYGFCFSPQNRTVYLTGINSYYKSGYDTRTFYFSNTSKTNSSGNIDLYLLSTATSDIVTFTVIDDFLSPLPNAEIRILRWDLVTDTFYLVNTIITDSNGQASSNLRLNDAYYVYMVSYQGTLYLTTEAATQVATTRTLQIFINQQSNLYETFLNVENSLTFDNSTNITTFTYTDPSNSISGGCIIVKELTGVGINVITQSCSTSTASVLAVDLTPYGNGNYVIDGRLSYNTGTQIVYYTANSINVAIGTDQRFLVIGRSAQVISMVFIGTMAMIGVATGSIPLGIILIIASFIILYLLGFSNFTSGFITTMACILVMIALSLQRRYT